MLSAPRPTQQTPTTQTKSPFDPTVARPAIARQQITGISYPPTMSVNPPQVSRTVPAGLAMPRSFFPRSINGGTPPLAQHRVPPPSKATPPRPAAALREGAGSTRHHVGKSGEASTPADYNPTIMRILVVTDEDWVLEDVNAALAEERFGISTTSNPHAVIDACLKAEADVVITDLQVGTMGGMAIIRNIRAAVHAGDLPPTPTVLLLDRGADSFIAGRAGADDSLRKPFGAFELRGMLDQLVGAGARTE